MSVEGVSSFPAEPSKAVTWVDRMGVWVSVACAVHCIALPLLLAAIPAVSVILWIGEGLERVLAFAAVFLAVGCLCWGFRIHRKKRLFLTFAAAATFIISGQLYAHGWVEVTLVVIGALGLVGSHLLNQKLCRSCHTCHGHSH